MVWENRVKYDIMGLIGALLPVPGLPGEEVHRLAPAVVRPGVEPPQSGGASGFTNLVVPDSIYP